MSGEDTTPWADNWPGHGPGQFFSNCRYGRPKDLDRLGEAQPLEEAQGQQAEGGMVAQTAP